MVNFNPGNEDVPTELSTTTEDSEDSQPEQTTVDDIRLSFEAFNSARAAEMKTGDYPHRVDNNRYIDIQKCLKERLNGGKFDYNVYLSCAGCKNCEQTEDQPLEMKTNQTEARLVKNSKEQQKIDLKNVENVLTDDNVTVEKLNDEIKRLNFELERMNNKLQKITEERNMMNNELLMLKYEEQRKYNEQPKKDENMAPESDESIAPKKDKEEIDVLQLKIKTMANLNNGNDIYDL